MTGDAEFTLDSVPDLAALTARRAAAAAAGLARFPPGPPLAYGDAAEERLLLFPAQAARGPAPVLMFIHGGFWMWMRAAEFAYLAEGFVPFGVALAVIDYPMIPRVRMADIVASCRRAVGFLHGQGAALGLDPARIFVAGNSAGGHLVAELMDRAWTQAAGLPADVIKGGTAVSGLFDLAPVAASFRNADLRFTGDEVARFSPLRRRCDIAAPLIVAVGGDETGEFLRQSAGFAAQVRGAEHLVVAGTNHITVVLDALARPGAELNRGVRRQVGGGK
jgi:arylformamidase